MIEVKSEEAQHRRGESNFDNNEPGANSPANQKTIPLVAENNSQSTQPTTNGGVTSSGAPNSNTHSSNDNDSKNGDDRDNK